MMYFEFLALVAVTLRGVVAEEQGVDTTTEDLQNALSHEVEHVEAVSNDTSLQAAGDWHWHQEQHWGTCVAPGLHCGSPGARSRHCCGGVPCVESPGESGVKRCLGGYAMSNEAVEEIPLESAAAEGEDEQVAEGSGAEDLQAAGDLHWHQEQHWGTCVAPGLHCGSPGARSRHCCGGIPCVESPGESGVKRCLGGYAMSNEAVEEIPPEGGLAENASAPDNSEMSENRPGDAGVTGTLPAADAVKASSFCRHESEVCGGPGHLPRPCCGNLRCQTLLGGDGKRLCVKPPQCISAGDSCNDGATCCGNAKCERLLGGDGTARCVEAECVSFGEECGGPGRQTLTCCSGECKRSSPLNIFSVKKCM